MAIAIKEITYGAYGRCLQLSNGLCDVVITLDFGPRIIRYGFTGKENMLCEAPQLKDDGGFKLAGGHRLWHSPEHPKRTYEPDNDSVQWEEIEDGIRTYQKPEPWAMMEKQMDICLDEESTAVTIVHRIINRGAWAAEFAAWAVTVMAPGGKQVLPMTQRDTGLLSNRNLVLWPYTKLQDHRVWFGNEFITIQQDATKEAFKIGINNEYGWAAYFNHGQLFVKQHIHEMEETYPDGGCSYETYTTDFMMEMESLSPLVKVEPGEELEHMECWALVDGIEAPENDDEAITALMNEVLGDACCDDDCCCCDEDCDCDCDCEDDEECGCGCGHDHEHEHHHNHEHQH